MEPENTWGETQNSAFKKIKLDGHNKKNPQHVCARVKASTQSTDTSREKKEWSQLKS